MIKQIKKPQIISINVLPVKTCHYDKNVFFLITYPYSAPCPNVTLHSSVSTKHDYSCYAVPIIVILSIMLYFRRNEHLIKL